MPQQSNYYYIRRFFAFLCFIIAICCGISFFITGMSNYLLLIFMIVFLVLTYLIAPYSQGRRQDSLNNWIDYFPDEWIISGFFYLISLPFRFIGLLVRWVTD